MNNLKELLEKNIEFINNIRDKNININTLSDIVKNINEEKITIISWMKESWKEIYVANIIKKTNIWENYIYLNKSIDKQNLIKSNIDIENYINTKESKYIFIQNSWKVEWIKDFLSKYYKLNKKIIIIWNDIIIPNIKNFEITQRINNTDINKTIKYWSIKKLEIIEDKKIWLELITNKIITDSIFNLKWVKNIDLYYYTITFLAFLNKFKSNRELLRDINKVEKIAPKTFYDYIDFSLQEKIIHKIELFDFKKNKIINWKNKYYFWDNWIRNYLTNFWLDKKVLIENLIFILLKYNNYNILWWKNWVFEFSFIWKKENNTIYIHISSEKESLKIKKEVNKLLKIWDKNKKYLLVENLKELNIKKLIYEEVEIIDINDFILKKSL